MRPEVTGDQAVTAWQAEQLSGETAVLHEEDRVAVMAAVRKLPRRQREVLVLRFYLDIGVSTVRSIKATAEQITADSIPPFRVPEPALRFGGRPRPHGCGWPRWLAPVAAAVSMAIIAAAILVVSNASPHPRDGCGNPSPDPSPPARWMRQPIARPQPTRAMDAAIHPGNRV